MANSDVIAARKPSGAEILLDAAGFRPGRFGWASDEFSDVEISEAEARTMDTRELLLRIHREGMRRGREHLKAEIRLNVNALLGTSL